jgi:hypothetical protein
MWGCSVNLPVGSELKWALPYPDIKQIVQPKEENNIPASTYFEWVAHPRGFNSEDDSIRSDTISVLLELGADSKLQGRLFFDSGLYTGLGASLLISGLYELLKVLTRRRELHQVDEIPI